MKIYRYRIINIILVIGIILIITIWWQLRNEISGVKETMEEVKSIDIRNEIDGELNVELSSVLDILMNKKEIDIHDIKVYEDYGEILIGCNYSLESVDSIMKDIKAKIKGGYIKELEINKETCEFTLFFIK